MSADERDENVGRNVPDDEGTLGNGGVKNEETKSQTPDSGTLDEVGHLKLELEERTREAEEYKDAAARAKADFYNYRTRIERDRARDRVMAAEGTVDALIPVLDNLDRTLQAVQDKDSPIYKGVDMVQKQFFSALRSLGLQVIEAKGRFDPSRHEALMVVETSDEAENGLILEELHRGYTLGDKVLRAAQVKIARAAEPRRDE
ncbi:MAG: nucleotide exchange factor GrpE [Synergistaceae bacterium]|jgi:molecular chaperone GrpE|nr:nucleotide exchange factor GrpE [Synergistaceae bacterium]